MSTLQIIFAAILLLGPLVAIHEFGHFWVARRLGVKVLTYSIGFGPVLWKRIAKDGVQYQLAAIPLGGYVRMLDSRESEVPLEQLPQAFDHKSPWARMAIVAAGPMINLLFAILLFWILFLPSSEQLNTRIAQIQPNTPAAVAGLQAGDLITAIDGQQTDDLESLNYALVERMGETGKIAVTVQREQQSVVYDLQVLEFLRDQSQSPLDQLGFYPWQPQLAPVIGQISPNEAAARQGLKVGDRFIAVNGQPVQHWLEVTRLIRQAPEQSLSLTIQRNGQPQVLTVMPQGKRDTMGVSYGYLGIGVQAPTATQLEAPAEYRHTIQHDPLTALAKATVKTWDLSMLTFSAFGKMISGLIGLDNLSGPITIAKVAGQSADMGWAAFLSFMALMSVSLGILNLLPIPMLDGGHLVYYLIEAIRGRPVSEHVQLIGLKVGMLLLGMLMFVALFNDFSRLG
ncbi:MAG: RIP metalloprotease RseP [Moraxellaceae bacterium]